MPPRLTISLTTAVRDDLAAQRVAARAGRRSARPAPAGSSRAGCRGTTGRPAATVASRSSVERDLGVGDEHGELRRRQAEARPRPRGDLGVAGQELQRAVEVAAALELADEPLVHRQHRGRLLARVAEQHVLLVVVAQHLPRDVVGHLGQQLVALLARSGRRRATTRSSRILMLTSWSELSTPAGVVDRVGVDADARQGRLDAAELGEAEVAALADHPARAAAAPSTRIASLALSPTSALVSLEALT